MRNFEDILGAFCLNVKKLLIYELRFADGHKIIRPTIESKFKSRYRDPVFSKGV
jgi:hypothetical protein